MLTMAKVVSKKRYWDGTKFRVLYEFKCAQCGASIWKRTGQFQTSTGLCRKCACARPNVRLQLRPHEWRFNSMVRGADARKISVAMTYDEYISFVSVRECHYCQGQIDWTPYKRHSTDHRTWGCNLDRKDNTKGYQVENCVVCCGFCNRIKNNHLSYEEMLCLRVALRAIVAKREGRI
jgi:hypothetical protein